MNNDLTGLRWRLDEETSSSWPLAHENVAFFDISIGPGVDPAATSDTLASNFTAAPTIVRSGPLALATGSFSSGATPNAFGPAINFDTHYPYTGGDLTIEFRFSDLSGGQGLFDGVRRSNGPSNGYGVDFSARADGFSSTATTAALTNFIVTDIVAVPEPTVTTAVAATLFGVAMPRRKRRANGQAERDITD